MRHPLIAPRSDTKIRPMMTKFQATHMDAAAGVAFTGLAAILTMAVLVAQLLR